MFSSFSAYLFGSSSNISSSSNVEEDGEKETEYVAVETDETDGDWLLVKPCESKGALILEEEESDHDSETDFLLDEYEPCREAHTPDEQTRRVDEIIACWIKTLRGPQELAAQPPPTVSRDVRPWLNDSWYITPPSCFTAGSPNLIQTSPMENLLIEHPSMSVYARINEGGTFDYPMVSIMDTPQLLMHSDVQIIESCTMEHIFESNERYLHRGHRHPSHSATVLEQFQTQADVQKSKFRQEAKYLHGKQLERHNKSQDFQSVGKRHRRKNFMKSPSGKSNNRKY